jgi:GlpG protein
VNWITVKKFPLEKDLTHITGFLRERVIQHHIYEAAGEQVIAVLDPRMVAPIAQFLDDIESGKWVISQDETPLVQAETSPVNALGAVFAQLKTAPVALALIFASALGAVLVALYPALDWVRWFSFQAIGQYAFVPLSESLSAGQWWRLVTPAFLHFGFLHLLFNSLWLWDLGKRLELLLGKKRFMVFFILAAALSNAAQYYWASDTLFGGMSGVVYALVGFIAVSQRVSPHPLTAVPPALLGFMLFWLALCMTGAVDYFIDGGVANAAHLGGLLVGGAYAFIRFKLTSAKN